MTVFCDACCLFELNNDEIKCISTYYPQNFDFEGQLDIITVNSFPDTYMPQAFYCFTTSKHFCYVWMFTYNKKRFSIILISQKIYPYLFFRFLEDMQDSITKQAIDIDPEMRLTLIWSTLASWHITSKDEAIIQFTEQPFQVDMKMIEKNYNQYCPFKYFGTETNFTLIWKCVYIDARILVLGSPKDPYILSKAVFGVTCMSGSFPFQGPILIAISENDPRLFGDISKYKLVATTNKTSHLENQFGLEITINPSFEYYENAKEIVRVKNKKMLRITEYLIDRQLLIDPYSEFFEKSIICDDLTKSMSKKLQQMTLNIDEFRLFAQTEKLRVWRKENRMRPSFRDSFLSSVPEEVLSKKTTEELIQCRGFLDEIAKNYINDIHVQSVVRTHRKIIARLLDNNSNTNSSESV